MATPYYARTPPVRESFPLSLSLFLLTVPRPRSRSYHSSLFLLFSPRPTVAIHGFLPTVSLPVSPPSAHVSSRCCARYIPPSLASLFLPPFGRRLSSPMPEARCPMPDSLATNPLSVVHRQLSCAFRVHSSVSLSLTLGFSSVSSCCHEFFSSLARLVFRIAR